MDGKSHQQAAQQPRPLLAAAPVSALGGVLGARSAQPAAVQSLRAALVLPFATFEGPPSHQAQQAAPGAVAETDTGEAQAGDSVGGLEAQRAQRGVIRAAVDAMIAERPPEVEEALSGGAVPEEGGLSEREAPPDDDLGDFTPLSVSQKYGGQRKFGGRGSGGTRPGRGGGRGEAGERSGEATGKKKGRNGPEGRLKRTLEELGLEGARSWVLMPPAGNVLLLLLGCS